MTGKRQSRQDRGGLINSDPARRLASSYIRQAEEALSKGERSRADVFLDRALIADPGNRRAQELKAPPALPPSKRWDLEPGLSAGPRYASRPAYRSRPRAAGVGAANSARRGTWGFWTVAAAVAATVALFAAFGGSDDAQTPGTSARAFPSASTSSAAQSFVASRTPTPPSSTTAAGAPPTRTPTPVPLAAIPFCASGDCDCADFASREQMLAVFNASPGDPHRLDGDNDGIPCENGVGSAAGGTTTTQPGQFIPYPGNGGGPTLCRDGTYSNSSGRGTCSHHGGIAR